MPTSSLHNDHVGSFQQRMIKRAKPWEVCSGTMFIPTFTHIIRLMSMIFTFMSRDSSVGIATVYELDHRIIGFRFPAGAGNFSFDTVCRPALGSAQPPIQWIPGDLSLGVKRPGCETDHTSIYCRFQEFVELCLHSPSTPSWCDAQVQRRTTGTTLALSLSL
jgi:hypothetical protein